MNEIKEIRTMTPDSLASYFMRHLSNWHSGDIDSHDMEIFSTYCKGVEIKDLVRRYGGNATKIQSVLQRVMNLLDRRARTYDDIVDENSRLRSNMETYRNMYHEQISRSSVPCEQHLASLPISIPSPCGEMLGQRLQAVLRGIGICTVLDLSRTNLTDLISVKGVGKNRLGQLQSYLLDYNIHMAAGYDESVTKEIS